MVDLSKFKKKFRKPSYEQIKGTMKKVAYRAGQAKGILDEMGAGYGTGYEKGRAATKAKFGAFDKGVDKFSKQMEEGFGGAFGIGMPEEGKGKRGRKGKQRDPMADFYGMQL